MPITKHEAKDAKLKIGQSVVQGDVMIVRMDALPDGAKKIEKDRLVVAVGEQSGHNHVLVAEPESKVSFYEDATGRVWCEVHDGTAVLGHWHGETTTKADHEAVRLFPGIFMLPVQREYDEVKERRVMD